MPKPIAVQLYSIRESIKENGFPGPLKRIADIGYKAVEPAGFFNVRPGELRKMVEDLGMTICSSHSPWAKPENLSECMDFACLLGLDTIVCGYGPDAFKTLDDFKATTEKTSKMAEVAARNGFTLFQHNHYWEFERIDGRLKYDIYRELCPAVKYEIDCFWSTNKGQEDAVAMLREFAKDTILLHMKDGLLDMKIDLMPLGTGDLPIPALVAEAPAAVKAVVVELDYCSEEMFGALEKSYRYMVGNGICEGNRTI